MDIQTIFNYTIIIIAIIYSIFKIIYKIKINGLKNTAKDLILQAETLFQTNENDERMSWCINQLIKFLPKFIQPYIKEQEMRAIIQKTFDFIQDAMKYTPNSTNTSENSIQEDNTIKQ